MIDQWDIMPCIEEVSACFDRYETCRGIDRYLLFVSFNGLFISNADYILLL